MGKIDTSEWKEFLVGDLFEAYLSKDDIQPKNFVEGKIPLVSSGKENNGIIAFVEDEKARLWEANTLTIDMFGKVFYQESPYFAVSHGRVNILLPKISMTKGCLQFIGCAIEKVASQKYAFNEMCTGTKVLKNNIKLPATPNGAPDWAYMESYMANLETKVAESLTLLQAAKDVEKKKVDTRGWGSFALGTLFNIVKGKRLTKAEMKSGETPFIGSSALNNGCTAMIGNDKNQHPENTITVCYNGSVGETFYQDQPYIASDDVNVLYPKFTMNRQIALFIVPLIKGVSSRYDYIDKWKKEAMEADKIYLPVDKNGDPDWDYMEEYMKMVQRKTENVLNQFVSSKKDCENGR
jgi:hypothetical protein